MMTPEEDAPEQLIENPFAVFTPEGLSASRVLAIFSTAMPGLGN